MFRRLVGIVMATLLGLAVAGCSSLPETLRNEAKELDRNIDRLEETVKQREEQYAAAKRSGDWSFFGPYAARENWDAKFAEARRSIATLRANYNARIKPIMDKNEPADAGQLQGTLRSVTVEYTTTLGQVNFVRDRMALIQNGRAQANAWRAESERNAATVAGVVTGLQPVISRAKADFPTRSADIDQRYLPIRRMSEEVTQARTVVETEHAKHAANSGADYAAFADAVMLIRRHTNATNQQNTSYRAQLASLSREYSLILQDMKIEYQVTVGRSSWNESSDYGEQEMTYAPVRISKGDYDYLVGLPDDTTLATRSSGWGDWSDRVEIDSGVWQRLGIDMAANWPDSSHDSSQFFIHEIEPIYFHQYTEVSGRNRTVRPFEEVDEEDFGRHANDFGMALRTKRLGQFEDEVVNEATPPGMDMVGDPRYGRWVPDGQGGQTWSFLEAYAVYALLTGNNGIYTRGDYDSYRRWREEERRNGGGGYYGWYGANRSSPVFGSTGSRTTASANYRNSPFSRVGGVRAVPSDIRSAGGNARTRGPGSRGK